jgi:hypothetical protein
LLSKLEEISNRLSSIDEEVRKLLKCLR